MNDDIFLVICSISIILALIFFLVALYRYKEYLDKKNQDLIFATKLKGTSTRWSHALFLFLGDFIVTKHITRKIRRRYEIVEPGQSQKVEKDTLRTLGLVVIVGTIVMIISLIISVSLYSAFSGAILAYIFSNFIINVSLQKSDKELLTQHVDFMMQVRHMYYSTNAVDTSIYESLVDAPEPIKSHMSKVLEILESPSLEEDMMSYESVAPNRYMRQFLSNCVMIQKFDDCNINGQSIFLLNLIHLKADIENELFKKRDLEHRLRSLTFVAIAPMFLLNVIKKWALGNLSELAPYYQGTYYIVSTTIICLVSVLIYALINDRKDTSIRKLNEHIILDWLVTRPFIRKLVQKKKNANMGKAMRTEKMLHRIGETITIEQFYLKKAICAIVTFLFLLCLSAIIHNNIQFNAINDRSNFQTILSDIPFKEELETIENYIIETADTIKSDKGIDLSGVQAYIEEQGVLTKDIYIKIASSEILNRVKSYQNDYFHYYELLLIIVISAILYQFPNMVVAYRKRSLERNMEDEVILFQSIILMMMHQARITRNDILEALESFARIFQKSISKTIDDMSSGENEALEQLKEEEPYSPFCKIIDNLLDADKIGVENACDEIEGDRLTLQEKRVQDNRIELDNVTSYCTFLAFIPFTLVIALYLVIPFFLHSLNMFAQYAQEMQSYI